MLNLVSIGASLSCSINNNSTALSPHSSEPPLASIACRRQVEPNQYEHPNATGTLTFPTTKLLPQKVA
ncbi:hypothetical protein JTE90_006647 [Oedothorax gibbosus]|uniref:Uncharacterized protein n=1 Tax=Oedothorax gibbosus TaxID=931172 RepID=A0AAV6TNB8_9ARAC|nr:hypothetical protein JTE90_006647 [Oedothorax gibbosus]